MSDKYAANKADQDRFSVRLMCAALGVSVSGFYAAHRRSPSAQAQADEQLRAQVRAVHAKSRWRYGAPRVHEELKAQGTRVAKERVARLMREDGLVARRPRRFVRTSDATHAHRVAPNRLARRFAVSEIDGLDRIWASDITYLPTREGFLYLAVVLDLASRRVVGWAMQTTPRREPRARGVAHGARAAAADDRPAGLLHYSDRGSQYAGGAYQALLAAHDVTGSMSRKGDCWDNAVAQRFFATLEHELFAETDFPSRQAARRATFEFIEA